MKHILRTLLLISSLATIAYSSSNEQSHRSLDPASLSYKNIFEEIVMNQCKAGKFTLYGLDNLGALGQGVSPLYNLVVNTLHPYMVFGCLDGDVVPEPIRKLPNFPHEAALSSVVQVFVFFAEAFGKELDPVYFYGIRPRLADDTFQTAEEVINVFDSFRDQEGMLRSKFTEITTVVKLERQQNLHNSVFASLPELYRFFAGFGMMYAQHNYGHALEYGEGIEQNLSEAADNYKRAAIQGCASSQNNYGVMLLKGRGVERNVLEAIRYFEMAVQSEALELSSKPKFNIFLAQYDYGMMLANGDGVKEDLPHAMHYLELASQSGDPDLSANAKDKLQESQYNYGILLANGDGVKKDLPQAMHYFKMAIEGDDTQVKNKAKVNISRAQYEYGILLANGDGVKKDLPQAMHYFKMAIEGGCDGAKRFLVMAQYNYGSLFLNGNGVKKDLPQAIRYLEMAAQSENSVVRSKAQGTLSYAQYAYGTLLFNGDGVKKDLLEAIRYLEMAAQSDNVQVKNQAKINISIARSELAR